MSTQKESTCNSQQGEIAAVEFAWLYLSLGAPESLMRQKKATLEDGEYQFMMRRNEINM